MKKTIYAFIFILTVCFCSYSEKRTYRQQYEENLGSNIEYCMQPFLAKGVDSLTARSVCHCIISTLFQLDSTFVSKDRAYLDKLIEANESELTKCKDMLEGYFD